MLLLLMVAASTLTLSEVFAKNSELKEKHTNPNTKEQKKRDLLHDKKWRSAVRLGGKYGNQRHLGQIALFSPLIQSDTDLLYLDLRFAAYTNSSKEGNFGIGKRWITANNQFILGIYAFYDCRSTEFKNIVNQLSLGFEAMSETWDYRANFYYPRHTTKERDKNHQTVVERSRPQSRGADLYHVVDCYTYADRFREVPLKGFDLEIGRSILGFEPLRMYGAYYHFQGKAEAPTINGFRLRANFRLNEYVSFQLEGSRDKVRKNVGFIGVQLTIPLGEVSKKRELTSLEKRMTELPRRDLDIVTSTKHLGRHIVLHKPEEHLVSSGVRAPLPPPPPPPPVPGVGAPLPPPPPPLPPGGTRGVLSWDKIHKELHKGVPLKPASERELMPRPVAPIELRDALLNQIRERRPLTNVSEDQKRYREGMRTQQIFEDTPQQEAHAAMFRKITEEFKDLSGSQMSNSLTDSWLVDNDNYSPSSPTYNNNQFVSPIPPDNANINREPSPPPPPQQQTENILSEDDRSAADAERAGGDIWEFFRRRVVARRGSIAESISENELSSSSDWGSDSGTLQEE